MKNICLSIRVYSRIFDLPCLVDIIKKTWLSNKYDIYVISNGIADGYDIPKEVRNNVTEVVALDNNAGHMSGSSQLLLSFVDKVPLSDYDYSIIVEADTWMYGDSLINKYVSKMDKDPDIVYAGAKWYDKYYSLATDFAIIKNSFLLSNRGIFEFKDKAECHVANYLVSVNKKFVYIRENMMPNIPSYLKHYPYADKGRICCFPFSNTVTHHIEHLEGGLNEKKRLFNVLARTDFFSNVGSNNCPFERCKITLSFLLSKILLRKTWYSKTIKIGE